MQVRVLIRACKEFARIVAKNPMTHATGEGAKFFVVFLTEEPDRKRVRAIDPAAFAPEEFTVRGREIYLWYPEGFAQAKLTYAFWEKQLGVTATARNWNTVTKLAGLCAES